MDSKLSDKEDVLRRLLPDSYQISTLGKLGGNWLVTFSLLREHLEFVRYLRESVLVEVDGECGLLVSALDTSPTDEKQWEIVGWQPKELNSLLSLSIPGKLDGNGLRKQVEECHLQLERAYARWQQQLMANAEDPEETITEASMAKPALQPIKKVETIYCRDFAYPVHTAEHFTRYPLPSTTQHLPRIRATFDFDASDEHEICFSKGDEMTVLQERTDGWLWAILNGLVGLVPSNHVEWISGKRSVVDESGKDGGNGEVAVSDVPTEGASVSNGADQPVSTVTEVASTTADSNSATNSDQLKNVTHDNTAVGSLPGNEASQVQAVQSPLPNVSAGSLSTDKVESDKPNE